MYADNLNCVSCIPELLLEAARLFYGIVRIFLWKRIRGLLLWILDATFRSQSSTLASRVRLEKWIFVAVLPLDSIALCSLLVHCTVLRLLSFPNVGF